MDENWFSFNSFYFIQIHTLFHIRITISFLWLFIRESANRDSQSVAFDRGQKMALRAFYCKNIHRTCGHISTWSALNAIFWLLLKTTGREPLSMRNEKVFRLELLIFWYFVSFKCKNISIVQMILSVTENQYFRTHN